MEEGAEGIDLSHLNEAQLEEIEVLESIYGFDPNFSKHSKATCGSTGKDKDTAGKYALIFQYMFTNLGKISGFYTEDQEEDSILLEIRWPSEYPQSEESILEFSFELFHNRIICDEFKKFMMEQLEGCARENAGESCTYTIIEFFRDNIVEWINERITADGVGKVFQTTISHNNNNERDSSSGDSSDSDEGSISSGCDDSSSSDDSSSESDSEEERSTARGGGGGLRSSNRNVKENQALSKKQKRRMFDKLNAQGKRERGWDWIDIVKHLSRV